jgi:hypothetical protein
MTPIPFATIGRFVESAIFRAGEARIVNVRSMRR